LLKVTVKVPVVGVALVVIVAATSAVATVVRVRELVVGAKVPLSEVVEVLPLRLAEPVAVGAVKANETTLVAVLAKAIEPKLIVPAEGKVAEGYVAWIAVCCVAVSVAPVGSVTTRVTLAAAPGPSLVNVTVYVPVGWPALRVAGPLRATVTLANALTDWLLVTPRLAYGVAAAACNTLVFWGL